MTAGPSFCAAGESDAPALLVFMREYYMFDGHGFDEARAGEALLGLLRNTNLGRVWLILAGAHPVGYVVLCFGYSLEWLGRDAWVDEVYLREDYRGRGWGRATMEFVEEQARGFGITALHLGVVRGNAVALHLYQSAGFRAHTSTFLSKWIARDCSKPQREPQPQDD